MNRHHEGHPAENMIMRASAHATAVIANSALRTGSDVHHNDAEELKINAHFDGRESADRAITGAVVA